MLTKTRLTCSVVALLVGIDPAHAQTAAPDPHHPQPPTAAGRPVASPGGRAAMQMPMHPMAMGGMPMHGGEMDTAMMSHVEGRIAFLKAELGISEAQQPAFDRVAAAMRTNATAMRTAMAAHSTAMGSATTGLARGDAAIAVMTARLDAMKSMHAACSALYPMLSEAQKKIADELAMHHMGAM